MRQIMSTETLKRWIGAALIIAAVLATALAWSGLSLRDILGALTQRFGQ
jgi:hypothetical protein